MRILLLRTSRLPQFYKTVDFLEKKYPDSKINVLTTEAAYTDLRANSRFEDVILFSESMYSFEALSEELLTKIKEKKFAFVVIIYTKTSGAGFENVHQFANELGLPVYIYDIEDNFYRYSATLKIKRIAQSVWQKLYWDKKIIHKIEKLKRAVAEADTAVESVVGEKSYEQIKAVRDGFTSVAKAVQNMGGEKSEIIECINDGISASIIIVNFNGKELLEECLPSVYEAIEFCGGAHEVIVVDNGSTDGSKEYMEENYPALKVVALPENLGFPAGCNRGVEQAEREVLVFLNNDLTVENDFLVKILPHFKRRNVFAVTAKALVYGTTELNQGQIVGILKDGALEFRNQDTVTMVRTLYVMGGGCAIDKKKFDSLNGFDELFSPGYWEDVDVCVRAWRRGWKSLYEPKAVLHHKVNVTAKKVLSQREIQILSERNGIIFSLKNYLESDVINDYWEHLTERITKKLRGKVDILWQALNQVEELLPQIISLRGLEKLRCLVTFKEIVAHIEEEI